MLDTGVQKSLFETAGFPLPLRWGRVGVGVKKATSATLPLIPSHQGRGDEYIAVIMLLVHHLGWRSQSAEMDSPCVQQKMWDIHSFIKGGWGDFDSARCQLTHYLYLRMKVNSLIHRTFRYRIELKNRKKIL
jgi:hypothetical protein